MSNPYVGEIRIFAGNFAPVGWAFCDGSLLPISENTTLFNLIGTTYGGDGVNTFALPDLRGRIPIHQGDGFTISQKAGTETVTLSLQQLPIHSHPAQGQAAAGTQSAASGGLWANFAGGDLYSASGAGVPMNSAGVANTGGSLPHDNLMPFLVLTFIISLFGIYPSQT